MRCHVQSPWRGGLCFSPGTLYAGCCSCMDGVRGEKQGPLSAHCMVGYWGSSSAQQRLRHGQGIACVLILLTFLERLEKAGTHRISSAACI